MSKHVLGMSETAALLGMSRQGFAKLLAKYPDFPKATRLSVGRIWNTAEVERWARKHGRSLHPDGRP